MAIGRGSKRAEMPEKPDSERQAYLLATVQNLRADTEFMKRQQWNVTAYGFGLVGGVLLLARNPCCDQQVLLAAIAFVVAVLFSVFLYFLQAGLARDRELATSINLLLLGRSHNLACEDELRERIEAKSTGNAYVLWCMPVALGLAAVLVANTLAPDMPCKCLWWACFALGTVAHGIACGVQSAMERERARVNRQRRHAVAKSATQNTERVGATST
jgi:hypothetical protein